MNSNEKNYLNIKELLSIPYLSGVNISEDGNNAAFVKTTADWKDNQYRNHIWLYEKSKGDYYALTSSSIEGTSPIWSPDSRHIAYLSSVGEKNQIFVQSIDDNSRMQITEEEEGVSKFKWKPDGKGFYYTSQSKESQEIKKRREIYGDFHHIGKEYLNHCLSCTELKDVSINSASYQLTTGNDFHIQEFVISNDGKRIVIIASPSPAAQDDQHRELYILELGSGEIQKLSSTKLLGGSVCFSPDASKICYTASLKEKEHYQTNIQDSTLEIYDLTSGEQFQPLIDFDSTVTPIRWTAKGILIRWQHKTNYHVGLLSEKGSVKKLNTDGFIMDASITKDGNHIACCKAERNETFEIYFNDKKITNENSIFKGKLRSNREIVSWKNIDDVEIEGVLTTPADFDASKNYPLLVLIHGGPGWASFPIHSGSFNDKYPVEQFVEKGFIVLEPNYRGSTGYGNDFLKANYRNLAIGDYDDVISGVDSLVGKGIADRDRVGVMGWSQGGFISAFCSIYSSRFKAASVGGAITNLRNHYVNTDIPYFFRMYLGSTPWDDPEIYSKTSPMTYIKSASTPTLIQHGEKDARVPITNAYDVYRGLRDMEVETELVVFKGMAYSSNQPGIHAAIMKQNLMWFSHYILGESLKGFRGV
ncbi:S9 family peptidase [Rossellomorea vietnamensis]|uniref:S9 family peptidase n=1 Tax=Rossellomorea vietnamensis TaxID=218284 RepID=A0A5D4MHI2_9BACI|nr:S9 family peptidase [Rossellomorea vietnamensis]TYS01290.1 S9 family peptidase [Rossellomorea vietnamensis]